MSWNVKISKTAQEDLDNLRAYHPKLYLHAYRITKSIAENPESGLGAPKKLRRIGENVWRRNLSLEHKIVYEVFDTTAVVASYRTHFE